MQLSRTRRPLRRLAASAVAAVALPLALGLSLPGVAAAAAPAIPNEPVPFVTQSATPTGTTGSGATVDHVDWVTDRQIVVWINSRSMGQILPVGVVLPRSWNAQPNATFPAVYYLDGFRAVDNYTDWYVQTDMEQFFQSREALAVTTFGGGGSFFSNWTTTDPRAGTQGTMQWEDFVTKDIPQVLQQSFRANGTAGIAGLSMGGTAAYELAGHNPGQYKAAQSFSGYLNTTSPYLPELLQYSIASNTPFNPTNLWGNPPGDRWPSEDPVNLLPQLKGTVLYAYAGGGAPGQFDEPSPFPGLSSNYAGSLLEIVAQYSTRNFLTAAGNAGVAVNDVLNPEGTHSWPYWNQQYQAAWPDMAGALGIQENVGCGLAPQFTQFASTNPCKSDPYVAGGGTVQDLANGRAFSSQATGTHVVYGLIGAKYQALGGVSGSPLGLPTGDESDGAGGGRYQTFQNGVMYYSAATGVHAVYGAVLAEYAARGYEGGSAGYPVTDEAATANGTNGRYQVFQNGNIYYSSATGAAYMSGPILAKWVASGFESGPLGFPVGDEVLGLRNGQGTLGSFQAFEKDASIYLSQATPASIITGPVIKAWGTKGYEGGQYGYPNSDTVGVPGGVTNTFQGGRISLVGGNPLFQ